ncbi:MAG: hypothetical protein LQ341_000978 [Variospora aurantia]|nr:MAG: hypothetical protein LQ341_000978 [Variospora aurantia]
MSSDILRQGEEDQYFYTSQNDGIQNQKMLGTDSMPRSTPHSTLQASNDIPSAMQYHSFTNTHSFDTNSQYSISGAPYDGQPNAQHSQNALRHPRYQSVSTLAPTSVVTPLALPGLLNTTSAQQSAIGPQAYRESQLPATSANGFSCERVEQNGSDLEEGELSEGNDHTSPKPPPPNRPLSTQQPQMYTSEAVAENELGNKRNDSSYLARRPDRSNQGTMKGKGQAADSRRTRQPHSVDLHSHFDSHAESDTSSPTLTSPHQRKRESRESSKAIEREARRAVGQLRLHNIGYLQLVKEHIDANLLKKIYADITVPESTQIDAPSAITRPPAVLEVVPSKTNLKPDSNESDLVQNTQQPVVTSDVISQQGSSSNLWPQQGQQHAHEAKEPGVATNKISHVTLGGHNNVRGNPAKVPGQALREKSLPQTKTDLNDESTGTSSTQNMTTPTPAAFPNISQPHVQTSANTKASKPPVPKAVPKPIDRKDYVARLLAAKAGKTVSTADAPKAPPDPAQQNCNEECPPGVHDRASGADAANISHTPSNDIPNGTKNAATEAKKREQTELARRKIEELKRRSETLKKGSSATSEAPPPAASAPPSPPERLSQALTVRNTTSSTLSALRHEKPQNPYFSSDDTAFALPGLFMSSQPFQPRITSEPVQVVSRSVESQQTVEDKLVADNVSDAVTAPHSMLPASESAEPDSHENTVSEKVPFSESSTPRAINNPRKRPTALDFIEPIPAKLGKTSHSSWAENSVVFEVSDDEEGESAGDASEMVPGHEQGVKTTDVREVQAPRSGSMEQANLRQHPALSGLLGTTEQRKRTPSTSGQALQAPFKYRESGGLRSNEEEIARMKRRIAEMEERRRSKQAASPAQTPGPSVHMVSSVPSGDSAVSTPITSGPVRRLSDPSSHVPIGQVQNSEGILENAPRIESSVHTEVPMEQQMEDIEIEHSEAAQPLEAVANTSMNGSTDPQRRRAEIESRIPSMSATVEEYMSKLQRLQQEQATLQAGLQKEMDEQRALQEELDKILQASISSAIVSTPENEKVINPQSVGHIQDTGKASHFVPPLDPDFSPREQEDDTVLATEPPSNVVSGTLPNHDLTTKGTSAPEPSTPGTAICIEAPTIRSPMNGELAEDVMDISGSESEASSAQYSPEPDTRRAQSAMESDSEELYEPPQPFGPVDEDSATATDSMQQQADHTESFQLSARASNPLILSGDVNRMCNVPDDDENNASVVLPPGPGDHTPNPTEMSDSDGYEPPEPVSSVDVDPLTNDASSIDSQCSSLCVANQAAEVEMLPPKQLSTGEDQVVADLAEAESYDPEQLQLAPYVHDHGHFTPYESPLQRFHAYRYHPDFVSRVASGYRSLTYSHNIDARKPVCPYEITGGRCNDASCENQHFKSMNLSGALGEQDA